MHNYHLFLLISIIIIVFYYNWFKSSNWESIANNWASENKLVILNFTMLGFTGWFHFMFKSNMQRVAKVEVKTLEGKTKSAYLCMGGMLLGNATNRVSVKWIQSKAC